jgi:hypothetical protein
MWDVDSVFCFPDQQVSFTEFRHDLAQALLANQRAANRSEFPKAAGRADRPIPGALFCEPLENEPDGLLLILAERFEYAICILSNGLTPAARFLEMRFGDRAGAAGLLPETLRQVLQHGKLVAVRFGSV